jgi:CBS domain containing-hemolysin-like protein
MEATGLLVLLVLILLNAFFVAAEYALVSSRPTKIQQLVEEGNPRAKLVQVARDNLNFYIAAIQLGITVAGLTTGFVAEPAIGKLLEPLLSGLGDSTARAISVVVALTISTILSVIFAELVPKSIAIQRAESVAMTLVIPLRAFAWLFGPISRALEWVGGRIAALFGIKAVEGAYNAHSEEEIRMIVEASSRQGVLEAGESEMVENVFNFGDKSARNVMTPRTKMRAIEADVPLTQLLAEYQEHGYSRFPVYDDSKDNIVGIVYSRELLKHLSELETFTVRQIMRPPVFVPESMGLRDLVNRLREKKTILAIVVDEYEGTSGMVTLEDVLEELVGEIYDETDDPEVRLYHQINESEYVLAPEMPFEDVEELLGISVNEEDEGEFDTVSGFLMHRFGDIPKRGDCTTYDDWDFTVEAADERRVISVRARRKLDASADPLPEAARALVENPARETN